VQGDAVAHGDHRLGLDERLLRPLGFRQRRRRGRQRQGDRDDQEPKKHEALPGARGSRRFSGLATRRQFYPRGMPAATKRIPSGLPSVPRWPNSSTGARWASWLLRRIIVPVNFLGCSVRSSTRRNKNLPYGIDNASVAVLWSFRPRRRRPRITSAIAKSRKE